MKLSENYIKLNGNFNVTVKNLKGSVIQEYNDDNLVVNDARTVTAFLVSQAILTGATRREYKSASDTNFSQSLVGASNLLISFMKLGGGFPRKRSFCNTSGEEIPLQPSNLSSVRNTLYSNIPFGSTFTDGDLPASWVQVGTADEEQPFHSSSLLYPQQTDIDLVDRDYQWAKRILEYSYQGSFDKWGYSAPAGQTFKSKFVTTMRYYEGNGPNFKCDATLDAGNEKYEYREAGLFMGIPRWMYSKGQDSESKLKYIDKEPVKEVFHPLASAVGSPMGSEYGGGFFDGVLTDNLRQYRFWDGHSELMSNIPGYEWSDGNANWPRYYDSSLTWESSLETRGNFSSVSGTSATPNENFNGYLYDGYLMVARKTFPTITKTEDLEFTITWTLTFG